MKQAERPKYYVLNKENKTVQEALKWISDNPSAWRKMQQLALDKHEELSLEGKSNPKMSARLLAERVRWDYMHVRIRNNIVPVLARLLVYSCPSLDGAIPFHKTNTERIVTTPEEQYDEMWYFKARCI